MTIKSTLFEPNSKPRDLKPARVVRSAQAPAGHSKLPSAGSSGASTGAPTSRLNKRMAELGMASRREADNWIGRGWVKVNGVVASMGQQVTPDARIEVNKQAQGQQANQVTILVNKPMGIVSGQAEDGHLPAPSSSPKTAGKTTTRVIFSTRNNCKAWCPPGGSISIPSASWC